MCCIRRYTDKIVNTFIDIGYDYHLHDIRYCIYHATNPVDLIAILKHIASVNKFTSGSKLTTDNILSILTDCFKKYPLTECELQKMSMWEQMYNTDLGIKNYVSTIFWLCAVQSIVEKEYELPMILI